MFNLADLGQIDMVVPQFLARRKNSEEIFRAEIGPQILAKFSRKFFRPTKKKLRSNFWSRNFRNFRDFGPISQTYKEKKSEKFRKFQRPFTRQNDLF